ncbi:MAG: c-type cytochrome biogenesis protein CcmI [Methylocystis sp.]|jgi:cytochrome c-type biogenesis protein CcmH
MIWLIFALLTGAALLAVLAPLAGKSASVDPSATDKAFFGEQIAEIERERDEGRLDPQDAEAARLEAARRLLRASEAVEAGPPQPSRRPRVIAAIAALVLIPAVAVPLYLHVGAANLPDMPLAERLAKTPPHQDLSAAVAQIEAHLTEHPEDGRGFEVVAPYYLRNGKYEEAVHAFSEALRLLGPTPTRYDALGEAYVISSQGAVTPAARRNFDAALALDAADAMSQYYLGLGAAQDGDTKKASEIWTKLLAEAPPNAGYRELVRGQLDRLNAGPDRAAEASKETSEGPSSAQGKAIAAMPKGDQQAVIRSMVDRLAGRLAQKGDDVEGWLKLIRAYSVLSEPEKAKAALADGKKALSGKTDDIARLDALAAQLNIER